MQTAAFLIGWLYQSMQVCMGIFGAGFAVALIVRTTAFVSSTFRRTVLI